MLKQNKIKECDTHNVHTGKCARVQFKVKKDLLSEFDKIAEKNRKDRTAMLQELMMKKIREEEVIPTDELQKLEQRGLVNKTRQRNINLRKEYNETCFLNPGLSKKQVREQLADKYYISYDNIKKILYKKE